MKLRNLQTPSLILDRNLVVANTGAMTAHIRKKGVELRPHMKTAKSIDVARLATDGNFGGITVSTLKEAEYFADHGITDILYAVCVSPGKLARAAALRAKGVDLSLVVDSPEMATLVADRGAELGVSFPVFIEIDTGESRSGLRPESEALIKIGRILGGATHASLKGIMVHAGHSYGCRSIEEIAAVAEAERAGAVLAAQRLRQAGLDCPTVSVGSTPTALHARDLTGVTEMRCGVYVFGDVFQSEIGSCGIGQVAVSVLATVIGYRRDLNCALIDAGALALSKDRSTAAPGLAEDIGFGMVMDELGSERIECLRVDRVYQEHGLLRQDGPFPFDRLPIGTRVRILPNHVCMTAAMYEAYQVVAGSDDVIATWPRVNGW